MNIDIRNIRKSFRNFTALKDITLHIPTGHLTALLGPSGCGKTTLLRIIAGLEIPESGTLLFDGEDASRRGLRERRVGFVFQHYALFRHMTVFENVAFGLRVKPRHLRPEKGEIREKVQQLLRLVQLDVLADRFPAQLSGGQRQRVALARALAVEPKVLLLDEPFGALDARVRQELRRWLKRLHDEIHLTSIFVTHDQEEALEVADRVVVMNQGQIEQVGTPEAVYHHPATPFVYHFLGNVNLFHGRVSEGKFYVGETSFELPERPRSNLDAATLFLRPHLLDIDRQPNHGSHFRARVKRIHAAGPQVKIELVTSWGEYILAEISHDRYRSLELKKGMEVYVSVKGEEIFISGDETPPNQ